MITKFVAPEYIMHRYEGNPIISKENFPVAVKQVFNCGQTVFEGEYLLLIAAVYEKPRPDGALTGIHVARSEDGINFDINPEPLFKPTNWAGDIDGQFDFWVIDPRVTKIDDTYYIVRPAQIRASTGNSVGPADLLFKTKDFKTAEFVECIALPSNRVPCLFPEKVNGEYVRLDRPYAMTRVPAPGHNLDDQMVHGMWISYSPDLVYWGKHRPILYPPLPFANYKVGPTPPIKTKDGWLEIIHGVYKENREWCYTLSAILLDLQDPSKIIAMLDKPILAPIKDYEINGMAKNVVFACGAIANEEKDEIRIYYGAADECIGLATGKLSELLEALKNSKK